MKSIKTLLLDNDGILVDTERLYYQATAETLRPLGIRLTVALFREHFLTQASGIPFFCGHFLSADEIDSLRTVRNQRYSELLETEEIAMPGIAATLETLKSRFQLIVVTSSLRHHFEIIHRRTGFWRFFDAVIVSGDYQHAKPAPDPYLRAIERTGQSRDELLVIEDSARGLQAAVAAGLRCWVIPTALTQDSDFATAERILTDFSELPTLLESEETHLEK